MTTTFGLSSTGFELQRLQDILASLQADIQSAFGTNTRVDDQSVYGQILGVMAARYADLWEACADIYSGAFVNSARGIQLDNLFFSRGITRNPATYSTVVLTFSGTNATNIPINTAVKDASNNLWYTVAAATISSGIATVSAQPANTGVYVAPAGTLTALNSPISGITGVTNALDAVPGSAIETDAKFLARGLAAQFGGSSCAVEGLRSALLKLSGVSEVICIENSSGSTDAYGRPPKSIECVVRNGTASQIAAAIWANKPAGIYLYGNTSATTVDGLGTTRIINYSTPGTVQIYVTVYYHKLSTYPSDIETQMLGSATTGLGILGYANTLTTGQEVSTWVMGTYMASIPGLDQVTIYIGTSANPTTSTPVTIGATQLAQIQSSGVTFIPQN